MKVILAMNTPTILILILLLIITVFVIRSLHLSGSGAAAVEAATVVAAPAEIAAWIARTACERKNRLVLPVL